MVGACIDLLNPDGDDTAADDTAAVVVAATDGARDKEVGKLEDSLCCPGMGGNTKLLDGSG